MSAAKHTPGPWEAAEAGAYSDYDGKCRVILGDDMRIAVVQGLNAIAAANAHLIAAAPDGYAAAEEALPWLGGLANENPSAQPAYEAVKAFLSKARGEQVKPI